MSRAMDADYEQSFLFPPCVEDWVGPDHPARFIRDFVDSLDLPALGFVEDTGAAGRPHYSHSLLLKVWLWGYMDGVRSSRKLEKACRNDVALLWLTGMHYPDHNTLWRFWNSHQEGLRNVFKQTVRVAVKTQALGMVVHAIDGTKIQAWVSRTKGWHKEDLTRLLEEIDAKIDALEETIAEDGAATGSEYGLPEALCDAQARKAAIVEALEELDEAESKHVHPHDLDARMMKTTDGVRFAYNAQAIADDKHRLIVAHDVSQTQNDHYSLAPMVEQARDTVGDVPEVTVGDGGYNTGKALHDAEAAGHNILLNPRQRDTGAYHSSNFHYDEEHDCYTCPQGQALHRFGESYNKSHGCTVTRYRCDCAKTCPVRAQCTKSKKARVVERSPWSQAVDTHRAKTKDPTAQAHLRKRKTIIEIVFAQIKQRDQFRRWTVRRIDAISTQWSLACTAYNLKILHRLHTNRPTPPPTPTRRKLASAHA